MKALLQFDLPEEQDQWKIHEEAMRLHSAIWDYAEWLRGICKHGNPDEHNAEACRAKLYELLNENWVSI